ncbi:uncharacterized, partial [Tachysurus ichikawai]
GFMLDMSYHHEILTPQIYAELQRQLLYHILTYDSLENYRITAS